MVGAPPGPMAAPPATPKSDPSSCPRSGGISCGCASSAFPSACPWLAALAVGGVGPEVEKEKEDEVWEEEEDDDDEDVVEVDVDDDEEVTGWPAVREKQTKWLNATVTSTSDPLTAGNGTDTTHLPICPGSRSCPTKPLIIWLSAAGLNACWKMLKFQIGLVASVN